MLRQYLEIKQRYADAILFYRLGDFYEMFFEDAEMASKILGIALTTRNPRDEKPVPLCGVPYHSVGPYLMKLVQAGHKVAICEQMEDPKFAKGVVKREVVRVVTPGLLPDPAWITGGANHFLAALARADGRLGLAALDLTTGEFYITEASTAPDLAASMARWAPKELLLPEGETQESFLRVSLVSVPVQRLDKGSFATGRGEEILRSHFGLVSLAGLGLGEITAGIGAAGALLEYVRQTQHNIPLHVRPPVLVRNHDHLILDEGSLEGLEVFRSIGGSDGPTLAGILNETLTRMGARLFNRWLATPLVDPEKIGARLDAVEELVVDFRRRERIRAIFGGVTDFERMSGKVALGTATVRDCVTLGRGLEALRPLKGALDAVKALFLSEIQGGLGRAEDLAEAIGRTYDEEGVIRAGVHPELDSFRSQVREARRQIAALEGRERARTGIASLKVRFNNIFGYYIEVTKPNLSKVPPDYRRRQTTVGGERFVTDELEGYEEIVLGGEGAIVQREEEIFRKVKERIAEDVKALAAEAADVARLDVIAGLAEVAAKNNYVRPEIHQAPILEIVGGRHPILERTGPERFVPNDLAMGGENGFLFVITGPNMAGKSTLLRQTALVVIMAQTGSFVPAARARIGICDRIFTRVGASDRLAKGLSTFMVEMLETALILNQATPKSLIILDEIGRGTSTYDGLAIAWAVAEHIHTELGARTLFATHYHELTQLADRHAGVRNFQVAVREWGGEMIFLHKVIPGGAPKSYGIQVARLAGLPDTVIERARRLLAELEVSRKEKPQTQHELPFFSQEWQNRLQK